MRQLITLNYDNLPRHLKACMMYMSIFPEDYVIAKDRLLHRWIAEGLVTKEWGQTLLEVAEEYFNELISRNMIQLDKFVCIEDPYHREVEVEGCRVNDIILEVMVSKSKESNFVSLLGRQYSGIPHVHDKIRRLSLHENYGEEQSIEVRKLQYVRSLTTFQKYGLNEMPSKLLNRLDEFKLLRVLDLEDCKDLKDKHMRDVCRLYLLRFLSLKGTDISEMPRQVGNLEHLETLDIRKTSIGKTLPPTVTKLSKLERLMSNGWLLPRGLWKMKALREVDMGVLTSNDVVVAEEIGGMPELQVLSIRIHKDQNGELEERFSHKLVSSLGKANNLRSFHLECWECGILTQAGSVEFLHDVQPPYLLQCLSLFGRISQLPDWISFLSRLTKFELGSAELVGDQIFDVLCHLANLQSVQLRENIYKGPEMVARRYHTFPELRFLKVLDCPSLKKLTFEKRSMTKIQTLVLNHWGDEEKEMSLVGVENLESLKEIKLRGKKSNLSMNHAVQELETRSTESNRIKVVVNWY